LAKKSDSEIIHKLTEDFLRYEILEHETVFGHTRKGENTYQIKEGFKVIKEAAGSVKSEFIEMLGKGYGYGANIETRLPARQLSPWIINDILSSIFVQLNAEGINTVYLKKHILNKVYELQHTDTRPWEIADEIIAELDRLEKDGINGKDSINILEGFAEPGRGTLDSDRAYSYAAFFIFQLLRNR